MKTVRSKFVRFFLMFALLLVSFHAVAQDRKMTRDEKKQMREAMLERNFYILDSLFNAKSFVLEADFLQNKYGVRVPVNPRINFIMLNETDGVLQTGSDTRIGYNNVGGVTAEGMIQGYKISKNVAKKTYTVRFNLLTKLGNYDVLLNVNADNNASATISGTTSDKLTWHGHLSTVDNSKVFKGMETI